MTPDDAICAAFRAASKEIARAPVRPDAYEGFLVATSDHLDKAAKMLSNIAKFRGEGVDERAMASLEHIGLTEIMAATVSAMLALGHYPYLSRIVLQEELH